MSLEKLSKRLAKKNPLTLELLDVINMQLLPIISIQYLANR